jgi:hypothetical protein
MSESAQPIGEKRRIQGRDPRETPRVRPIADSDVELFVPGSSKPVLVYNAHARRLFYYFAMPLTVFAFMAGIGVWVFMLVAKESAIPSTRPASPSNSTSGVAALVNSTPPAEPDPTPVKAELAPVVPTRNPVIPSAARFKPVISEEQAQQACDIVRELMEQDTLAEKAALTTDPEAVVALFSERYRPSESGVIQPRALRCEKQFEQGDQLYLVVNATLFDFSKREYIVERGPSTSRVVIMSPESLLP